MNNYASAEINCLHWNIHWLGNGLGQCWDCGAFVGEEDINPRVVDFIKQTQEKEDGG